jgi:hypothetical protein
MARAALQVRHTATLALASCGPPGPKLPASVEVQDVDPSRGAYITAHVRNNTDAPVRDDIPPSPRASGAPTNLPNRPLPFSISEKGPWLARCTESHLLVDNKGPSKSKSANRLVS